MWLPSTFLRGTASLRNTAPWMLPAQHMSKATLEITSTPLMPFPPAEMRDESNEQ